MGRGVSQQGAAGVLAWEPAPGDSAPPATPLPPGDNGGTELDPPSGEVADPPVPAALLPTSSWNVTEDGHNICTGKGGYSQSLHRSEPISGKETIMRWLTKMTKEK